MKSVSLVFIVTLAANELAFCQSYEDYIRSFTKVERVSALDFERVIQNQNRMTKEEAIKFVYNGDTSRIVCVSQNFNMITEQKGALVRSIRLPSKCLLLDMGDYFLVGFSSFDCQDPSKTQVVYLNLAVLSKTFKVMDRLIAYRETYEFPDILGRINSKNGLIFLTGYLKTKVLDPSDPSRKVFGQILKVDKRSLKFELIKESSEMKGNYTNLSKSLKSLGWEELFNAEGK